MSFCLAHDLLALYAIPLELRGFDMALREALQSGLAGATALTVVHETVRKYRPDAPRMDILGERAIARLIDAVGGEQPSEEDMHQLSLAGDLVSNSLYYSLVGAGPVEGAWLRGAALGLAAGVGAVTLPGKLGLGTSASNRTAATQVMTVAWYIIGGLAAAGAYQLFARGRQADRETASSSKH
jgi:hypothetical protein